ncbi:XkdW family protein [Mesobacillus subterraneus]|uniref:XkdW family protein n=1 Tax=Mesobacillus subterraneus TaxID=285983 RepID=UPI001472D9C7|nr:XkdW family protein [Mesobacillus subterraneus]
MNKEKAILKIYPEAVPNVDFIITADPETLETTIHTWKYDKPKPTDSQLQAAWDDLQANPPVKPKSLEEQIKARLEALELATITLMDFM